MLDQELRTYLRETVVLTLGHDWSGQVADGARFGCQLSHLTAPVDER